MSNYLNQCIYAMWEWIAERIKAGDERDVEDLKRVWCKEHGFIDISCQCFFCEYAISSCRNCPERKIDKSFGCCRTPDYGIDPVVFYYELLIKLNKKRLSSSKEKVK